MAQKYSSGELMAAILDLRDGLGDRIDELGSEVKALRDDAERGLERLRYDMNKRFDSVDLRFDVFERRVNLLEQR